MEYADIRVRSSQSPDIVKVVRLDRSFLWPEIKRTLLRELDVDFDEDIYFVLLGNDGKVAGPTIMDDKRFWSLHNKKYIEGSDMVFELNFRHQIDRNAANSTIKLEVEHSHLHAAHSHDLHAASIGGNLSLVKKLVEQGAHLSSRDDTSSTPLHYACAKGYLALVKYLLAEKAIIKNYRDNRGRTPLLCAASGGHLEVVQCLLAEGVFPFVVDEDGNSALHVAALHGHTALVDWLVQSNVVDLEIVNKAGQTYLQICPPPPPAPAPSHPSHSEAYSTMWCRLHGHLDSQQLRVDLSGTWEQLCGGVVTAFALLPVEHMSSSRLVTHAVLIEEDGDEGSGRIDDMRKFCKMYKKLYRSDSGMLVEFHLDKAELVHLLSTMSLPLPTGYGGDHWEEAPHVDAQEEEHEEFLLRGEELGRGGKSPHLLAAPSAGPKASAGED